MKIEGLPHSAVLFTVRDDNRIVHVTAFDGKTICDCGDSNCNHGQPVREYFDEIAANHKAMNERRKSMRR